MICEKCKNKLKVQQTLVIASNNKIVRRRFCPECRIVYISEENIIESYPLIKDQNLLQGSLDQNYR